MAYQLALDPKPNVPTIPGASGTSRALIPQAPTASLALPSPLSQVDHSPFLSTPAPQFTESIISLADLLGYMRRYWLMAALAAIPVAAFVFYMLGMGAKVYEAEAKLRMRIGDGNVLNLPEMGRGGAGELSAPQLINNHLTEIKSHPFFEFLAERQEPQIMKRFVASVQNNLGRKDQLFKLIGLYKPGVPGPDNETFVAGIETAARVEPLKDSHIIRVIVRHGDPDLAASLANSMASEYIRFQGQQESGMTKANREFLHQKAAELRARLEESEKQLAEYRKSENLIESGEAKNVDSARMLQFNSAITEAQQRLIKARNDLQIIRITQQAGRDLMEVRVIAENPVVAMNRKDLETKMAERRELEPLCGRRHPLMMGLARAIEELKISLDRSTSAIITMTEAEVKNLESQITDYQGQVDSARGMAVEQSGKHVKQNLLLDQVAADRKTYQTIVESLNKADVAGDFTGTGALSLSDTASVPMKPVKPNKPMAAVVSFFVFGIMVLGVPLGWGLFEQHVLCLIRQGGSPSPNIPSAKVMPHIPVGQSPRHPPEVRSPTVPLMQAPAPAPARMAPLPTSPPPPPMSQITIPGIAQAPILARLPLIGMGNPEEMLGQLLKPEPLGAAGALHQITTTLEMQALKRSGLGGIILLTSAEAGEGKTVAAAALAAAFCHQGRSVFMMECNAVSPTLHHWFPHASHHSSWAHDLESLRYGNTHLFLLPAHDLPAYATNELLDGYRAWIDRARQHVDWIILDAGPVLKNFTDVAPLAPLATDVLLVHQPATSNPAKMRAALNLLQPMMSSSAFRGLIVHGS
jgi:uncharacterized protein involved in exopolysaccharide biosynthesis/Mrp family chromosome partitioning ATPase